MSTSSIDGRDGTPFVNFQATCVSVTSPSPSGRSAFLGVPLQRRSSGSVEEYHLPPERESLRQLLDERRRFWFNAHPLVPERIHGGIY